ncbi:MAG: histidine phosphatase superfamily branch 1 [Satyrvirus sp.]|uniref:Histidine phosphatase superfamily branch 1 n=1 Tax=Satyrvirus sp. TaxID=2487771 RepID=A0A3G5AE37_9VIRU|nr:MAG: histidine phosphatase superfamily branch 1 [Satyrvirus sp.]
MHKQKYFKYKTKYLKLKMQHGGGKDNSNKKYVYIRHGERPSQQKNQEIKDKWKESKRFKQNHLDEPLTEKGLEESYKTGVNLLKHINIDNFDYIYSSPWTRCIQTSIQILKAIENETGKKLKIRVEYGLAEPMLCYLLFYLPEINGDEIASDIFPKYIVRNNAKEIVDLMDNKLHYSKLLKKYSNFLDQSHKPLFTENDVNNSNLKKEWQMQLSTARMISEQPKSSIVVSHANKYCLYHQYYLLGINKLDPLEACKLMDGTDGPTSVNFVMIYQQNDNKWEKILSPQRII